MAELRTGPFRKGNWPLCSPLCVHVPIHHGYIPNMAMRRRLLGGLACRRALSSRRVELAPAEMARRIADGDRLWLARGITLVESLRDADSGRAAELVVAALAEMRGRGRGETASSVPAFRVGFCGPPGAGKSSLIERLGRDLVGAGSRVAVLTVDPSSHLTGGSILGDKTRMPGLAALSGAYVRSSATWGTLGGVTHATSDAVTLCEAAGYDVVFVETVGVGQSEVAVAQNVDMVALLVSPTGGDELQGMKKGVVEIADLVLVTKSDGDNMPEARRTKTDYARALQLVRRRHRGWKTPVQMVSAHHDPGSVAEAWSTMRRYRDGMLEGGDLVRQRERQRHDALWPAARTELYHRAHTDERTHARVRRLEDALERNELTPRAAARELIDEFLRK